MARHMECWAGDNQPTVCSCGQAWPCPTILPEVDKIEGDVARIAASPSQIGAINGSFGAIGEFCRRWLRRKHGGWVTIDGRRCFVMRSSGGNLLRISPAPPGR